ncbi:hypothetical protein FQV27_10760 [Paracoccus aurantiacus]|uniref:Uncharacterized protein n=1 Tax=Paracoccus aurantiacus TaxID=2599412 RepID=A0A5C6S477_9RHOB|nr:hypothetical protein [Paracoccus aurantiacus]TXB68790.1 hypothetical protein FQV27_10760 [Paracoccus aurantiacus]
MSEFESYGVTAGIWSGRLLADNAPARIRLFHLAAPVAEAQVLSDGPGAWKVEVAIPPHCLSDGMQSLILMSDDGQDEALSPSARHLATLTLVAGAPLDTDLRAEIDLIRAELDLLKREFRRYAAART